MIIQTEVPQVPIPVPRATADVTSPMEPCSIVLVSNLIFCWYKNIIKSVVASLLNQFLTLWREMYLFCSFQLKSRDVKRLTCPKILKMTFITYSFF